MADDRRTRERRAFVSRLVVRTSLPPASRFGRGAILLHDASLPRRVPGFRRWADRFPARVAVRAGERAKSLPAFSALAARLLPRIAALPRPDLTVVAVGGGSVGDLAGFLASVLKRGVPLVQIPSTWLAAVDSAHGGKNALNVGGVKNQLGTFWPPLEVHIVRSVLEVQPEARAREALAEVAKVALIDGRPWVRALRPGRDAATTVWASLRHAVAAKNRVVRRDPLERRGLRHALNLGHTLGHVLEARHAIPHGRAVAHGLRFSVDWSERRGWLPGGTADQIREWLASLGLGFRRPPPLSALDLRQLVRQDKKTVGGGRIRFVFVRGWGRTRIEAVRISDLVREARRQGWLTGSRDSLRRVRP